MLKLIFTSLLFVAINAVFAQDILHPVELEDSCVYLNEPSFFPNTQSVNCIPNYYTFHVQCDIENYHVFIYNRWGEVCFESDNVNESWDSAPFRDGDFLWRVTGLITEGGTPYYFYKEGKVVIYY